MQALYDKKNKKGNMEIYLWSVIFFLVVVLVLNVLTFVDTLNKDLDVFKQNYESLCEYSHPNWAGTLFLYSKPDTDKIWTDFGKDVRDSESVFIIGLVNLNVSLSIFEHSYSLIGEMLPDFINICEKDIEEKNKNI